jgi:hypothetical protein
VRLEGRDLIRVNCIFLLSFKHQPRFGSVIHGGDVFVVEVASSLYETSTI